MMSPLETIIKRCGPKFKTHECVVNVTFWANRNSNFNSVNLTVVSNTTDYPALHAVFQFFGIRFCNGFECSVQLVGECGTITQNMAEFFCNCLGHALPLRLDTFVGRFCRCTELPLRIGIVTKE